MDDGLDLLHKDYIQAIFESHHGGVIDLQAAVQLALIGRYYERIGDHAVNIGARVEYMVTGWLPEHSGAARLVARRERAAPRARRSKPTASSCAPSQIVAGDARFRRPSVRADRGPGQWPLPTALLAVLVVVVAAVAALADPSPDTVQARRSCATSWPAPGATPTTSAARAEDARRRLVHALDAIPQAVLITDADGRVIFRNQSAETFESARHSDALVEAAITELVGSALAGHGEQRTIDLFGPPRRTLVIATTPLLDARAEQPVLRGALAVVDDVSERRRLEATRRDFVANISHELRTPDRRDRACWPRRCWPRTTPTSPTDWPSGSWPRRSGWPAPSRTCWC